MAQLEDQATRNFRSAIGRKYIDGKGGLRIVEFLKGL